MTPLPLTALALLAAASASRAQTVLVGDSLYQGLRTHRDSLASVVARLGRHYRRQEVMSWYTARLRGGGISGTFVAGHALYYRRLKARFSINDEDGSLLGVWFYPGAPVVTTRGIRPGAATFADVVARYGPPGGTSQPDGQPRTSQNLRDRKTFYTTLRYEHIKFVSRGRRVEGENLLARTVDEIWLL